VNEHATMSSSPDPIRHLPFRVVLIETHYPGNLGSVARAMKNLGFDELYLVNPQADARSPQAGRMAVHAASILETATTVATLDQAIGDCVMAVGTASKVDGVVRSSRRGFPREIMPQAVQASQKGKVAIVFGNEPNGLSNEQVGACTHLLEIPTSDLYDSMNLATAVGICLYELRLAWLDSIRTWVAQDRMASLEDQNRCFSQLKQALESIGFLYGVKSQTLFEGIKHLLMRCHPELKDLKLLHGLARQILWFVANHGPKKENQILELPSSPENEDNQPGDVLRQSH